MMHGNRNHGDKELDVDFAVVEDPLDMHLPRRPNVVSRRGHKVKITGYIREIKDEVERLNVRAEVFLLGPQALAPGAHTSRRMRLWGDKEIDVEIPPDANFPFPFEIIVEEKRPDEHLGQGPDYGAIITMRDDTPSRLKAGEGGEGATQTRAADDQNKIAAGDSGDIFAFTFVSM